MKVATFTFCFRYVRSISQRATQLKQGIAMDFESAASTIPPLGQTVACALFKPQSATGARGALNTILNIRVPCAFRSTPIHRGMTA